MTQEELIRGICSTCITGTYDLGPDLSVNVNGSVNLAHRNLLCLPINFNTVSGNFYCEGNRLTTLHGAPHYVGGVFDCSFNRLINLNGLPKEISGNLICSNNSFITFEGMDKSMISGDLACFDNFALRSDKSSDMINFKIFDQFMPAQIYVDHSITERYKQYLRIKNRIDIIKNILN